MTFKAFLLALACAMYASFPLWALAQDQNSPSISAFSLAELVERTLERRAVEAAIWGMPAVNYDLMLQEMLNKTRGKVNQVI